MWKCVFWVGETCYIANLPEDGNSFAVRLPGGALVGLEISGEPDRRSVKSFTLPGFGTQVGEIIEADICQYLGYIDIDEDAPFEGSD